MVDYNMHNQNNFFRHKKKIMHLFLTFSRSMGEKKNLRLNYMCNLYLIYTFDCTIEYIWTFFE